jgi:uncharacterized protein
LRNVVRILIGLGLLFVVAGAVALFQVRQQGLWGIIFPSVAYETLPPEIAADFGDGARVRVLVYSKTNSFRHVEGIAAAEALFAELAKERDWAVFSTENSAVFAPHLLERFDVVVFSNASGNHASDEQDQAFRGWLEQGGGWLGIHSAGDDSHSSWSWYAQTLQSGSFIGHILGPQFQEARVVVEDRDHPVTRGLPPEFRHEEEWYSWDRGAREAGFDVLLTVDESTYAPRRIRRDEDRDLSMGDHPIVWSRCVARGAAVYSAMGHSREAYEKDYMRTLLRNSVDWLAGDTGCETTFGAAGAAQHDMGISAVHETPSHPSRRDSNEG